MAPPRQILRRQLEILVDFVEENKILLNGISPGRPIGQQVRQKWTAVAKKLNAVESGVLKSPERWKKYWFEWRNKCRKKAADARRFESGANRFVPLNDLEIRLIELTGKGTEISPKQAESYLNEDSDSQPLENIKVKALPIRKKKTRQSVASSTKATENNYLSDDEVRSVSPPPKWALEIEERRVAAEERVAGALEAIVSVLQSQEARRNIIEDRIVDTITTFTETVQDLNGKMQEVLQRLDNSNSIQTNEPDFKGNFVL